MAKFTTANLLSLFLLALVVSVTRIEVAEGAICEKRWYLPYCTYVFCNIECLKIHPRTFRDPFGCVAADTCLCSYDCN